MDFAKPVMLLSDTLKFKPLPYAAGYGKHLAKPALQLKMDSAKLHLRHLSDEAITRFANDPDFNYQNPKENTGNWLENFLRWLSSLLHTGQAEKPGSPYLTYVIVGIIFIIIVVALVKMARQTGINVIGSDSANIDAATGLNENIHQISFNQEIEKATAEGNYRLAVRLLYLRTLKQLNDTGLIYWKQDKTNAAYYHEIKDSEQQHLFGLITRQFEYVWYGDFTVDSTSYQKISGLFNNFQQQLR
ncbi:DUF4129 domain-containing protein [Mucilaginibacter terrae]|uniref:Protein-glutamine gamma-glutamyltransferase-like C-terminal domain-containing protein n=1 Tax=Mucilaginibacter terrae TaxID=1955052 RepID=A0ABU3H1X4_9SPHI|nr:DUF4129 domain-containing protein [Mucilaginibacter terrae]MDT3405262.1 hypothetical protein [Mucilaginibacter terrae]